MSMLDSETLAASDYFGNLWDVMRSDEMEVQVQSFFSKDLDKTARVWIRVSVEIFSATFCRQNHLVTVWFLEGIDGE